MKFTVKILFDGLKHVSLKSFPQITDRVIVLDGWSKTYAMTGWRLGYGIFLKVFLIMQRS